MKIVFIGAGSTVFAKNLLTDLLLMPDLRLTEIALVDIDEQRMNTTGKVAEGLIAHFGRKITVTKTTDRRKALQHADFILLMFQVGGYKPSTVIDFEIPKKYGLQHTIADTLGVGGIMRALRTLPVMFDICREVEEICPEAVILNYVNPMAMICLAVQSEFPDLQFIGLCHSVQGTARELAHDLKKSYADIKYFCAGINHMAFYLTFQEVLPKGGVRDLYPDLLKLAETGNHPKENAVRYDVLKKFEYFVTESSEHFSEYVPWYIKRDRQDLIRRFHIPLDEYLRRCEEQIANWDSVRRELENGTYEIKAEKSIEYASTIIHALTSGTPAVVNANVMNYSLIDGLPNDCCVEVPCLIDRSGIHPVNVGALPTQLTALIRTNVSVQQLTAEAYLNGSRMQVYQAAYMDPHTAAELDMDQITKLVDELIEAHGDMLPQLR